METERGFSLLELLIAVALVSAILVGATALRGEHAPNVHAAALGLQAALVETRALAMSNAGAGGSGATLTVAYEGNDTTTLSVFAYRPIQAQTAPQPDLGFPPERFPVSMTVPGLTKPGESFSILVSSSGYASIAPNYVYDGRNALTADPGCNETAGVSVTVTSGADTETHPLDCRETQYQAVPDRG